MRLPCDNAVITSHYGWRTLNGKKEMHDGIDFISRESSNVYAIGDGIVAYDMDNYDEALRWIDRKHSLGNFLIIDHIIDNTLYHVRYCHLKENLCTIGQRLSEGIIIGHYADVGYSFGPHIHIDAYLGDWKKINIEDLFFKAGIL
jgi:murein DD-endopeptidase MepM/ murein hydrolase activator NlpD